MCLKIFHTTDLMRTPLKSHVNENDKPWRFSHCSHESKSKGSLSEHLEAVHAELTTKSREKLLQKCEFCDFTTSFNKMFKRHLASHSEERPFVCTFPGCNHRTKTKYSLKVHETLHNPKRELDISCRCNSSTHPGHIGPSHFHTGS